MTKPDKDKIICSLKISEDLIYHAMDEYAKQEAIGFELWMIEKEIYRIKDTDMYESKAGEHYAASPGQLYEYYQQQKQK